MILPAYAQDAAPAGGGFATNIIMLVFIAAVFYFLLIRPQQKRARQHREMLGALAVGDEVVTSGGILGAVRKIGDTHVEIDLGGNKIALLQKGSVQALLPKGTIENL